MAILKRFCELYIRNQLSDQAYAAARHHNCQVPFSFYWRPAHNTLSTSTRAANCSETAALKQPTNIICFQCLSFLTCKTQTREKKIYSKHTSKSIRNGPRNPIKVSQNLFIENCPKKSWKMSKMCPKYSKTYIRKVQKSEIKTKTIQNNSQKLEKRKKHLKFQNNRQKLQKGRNI